MDNYYPDYSHEADAALPFDGMGSLNTPSDQLPNPKGEYAHSAKTLQGAIAEKQLSPNSSALIGIQIVHNGVAYDPTSLTMSVYRKDPVTSQFGAALLSVTDVSDFTKVETGVYEYRMDPTITSQVGSLKVLWSFEYDDNGTTLSGTYEDRFSVVRVAMNHYDALTGEEKFVVEQVSWLFADLYDSMNGGPHLQEEFQTNWGLNRLSQLLHHAVNGINFAGTPMTNYGVGGNGKGFPMRYQGLLVLALYVQALEHFVRTYVEQPSDKGVSVPILDRRDYMSRWQGILNDKKAELKPAVATFKRASLNLGRGNLLVSGGMYGNAGRGSFVGGGSSMGARAMRWYPTASFIVSR